MTGGGHSSGEEETYTGSALALRICLIVLVIFFSGCMSGMTVGLFALDPSHLKVKARSGTAWQQASAKRVLFFAERAHWSLVSLLVSNALAMTVLPLLLDALVSPMIAIVLSVTAVLFFGEVIPQALFVRHGFTVISWLTPLLFLLLVATSPFSWPCAKLLDYVVGHQALAARDEIEKHVRIVEGLAGGGGDSDDDEHGGGGEGALLPEEIQVMRGALSISKKTLRDVKGVSVPDAFMLPSNAEITSAIIDTIVREGKSRVPVHLGNNRTHVIGVLLTKTLLAFAYEFHARGGSGGASSSPSSSSASAARQAPKIGELPLREPFRVQEDAKVSDLLKSFKTGQSHLAAVYNKAGTLVKFVTLDDVFQMLSGGGGNNNNKGAGGGAPTSTDEMSRDAAAAADAMGGDPKSVKSSNSVNHSRNQLVASAFNAIRESQVAGDRY